MSVENPASPYGPIAEQEFAGAADYAKPALTEWLNGLPMLDDETFTAEAGVRHSRFSACPAIPWQLGG